MNDSERTRPKLTKMANFLSRAWIEQQTLDQLKSSLTKFNEYANDPNILVSREEAFDWLDDKTTEQIEKGCRAQITKVLSIN
jgi:hypothetical protein